MNLCRLLAAHAWQILPVPSKGLASPQGRRPLCSIASGELSVAVVGSGPAGFYFTDRICRLLGARVRVDILEELPTPFGLVRSGVAPDHPDTKKVIKKFDATARRPNVRFFGGVAVGAAVSLEELRGMYHCVVLAYGASGDRRLGVAGEEASGCFSAREFVNWYNGHPHFTDLPVNLSKVTSVGVVGVGNVALDCARILLRPVQALERTDISDHALRELRHSSVSEVHIIGRRGPMQAQFSGKELREVLALENVSVTLQPENYTTADIDVNEPRRTQRVRPFLCLLPTPNNIRHLLWAIAGLLLDGWSHSSAALPMPRSSQPEVVSSLARDASSQTHEECPGVVHGSDASGSRQGGGGRPREASPPPLPTGPLRRPAGPLRPRRRPQALRKYSLH
jgi:hypothetical protein